MPKRTDIKKVLLIGSGPIQIGQAAEFDFSGSQACRSLREEGIEVVLVNSNPATIMTDPEMAERIYIEPLRAEIIAKIIEKETPDGILSGMREIGVETGGSNVQFGINPANGDIVVIEIGRASCRERV